MTRLLGRITKYGTGLKRLVAKLRQPREAKEPESSVKQVYKSMPDKATTTRRVSELCREMGVEVAPIEFVPSNINSCEDDRLILMDPAWATEMDGPIENLSLPSPLYLRYWCSVLHEVAHWVAFKSGKAEEVDHRPLMYSILIGLILREKLPLDVFWHSEYKYMPGSLARGSKLAGDAILENALGQSLVTKKQPAGVLVPFPTPARPRVSIDEATPEEWDAAAAAYRSSLAGSQ